MQKRFQQQKKVICKINKEYAYLNNCKADIRNKIISYLKNNYEFVCYQNESVKAWQRVYGKKITNTAIGGIINAIEQNACTPIKVDKFFPSTKRCSVCHEKQDITLGERVYICKNCHSVMDRDFNASVNILQEGLTSSVPMEHRDFKPVETYTSTLKMREYFNSIPHVSASIVFEAGSLTALA